MSVSTNARTVTRRRFLGAATAVTTIAAQASAHAAAAQSPDLERRFDEACRLIRGQVDSRDVSAAVLNVRRGRRDLSAAFGAARIDLPFLIASPTKPMTAFGVLWLRDRGKLALSDRVSRYLPAFRGDGRDAIMIGHLLTHTSGLPDMLPENTELRRQHAPLSEFVARTCRTPLLFTPGEKVSYQSMGILLAAAIAETVGGEPMPRFIDRTLFTPLGMRQTSFGLGGRAIADTARCQVPDAERSDWDWNSPYWRTLAAPWGGAHATAGDLVTFLDMFAAPDGSVLDASTRREMCAIQTGSLRPSFGLGWQRDPGAFGRTCSAETFGHFGSTGTMIWHDPATATSFVLLTTRPAAVSMSSLLLPVSEIIGGA